MRSEGAPARLALLDDVAVLRRRQERLEDLRVAEPDRDAPVAPDAALEPEAVHLPLAEGVLGHLQREILRPAARARSRCRVHAPTVHEVGFKILYDSTVCGNYGPAFPADRSGSVVGLTPAKDEDVDELATLYEGLSHPVRVAAYQVLRDKGRLPLADLRREVSKKWIEIDTRNLQFHLYKMQVAGIVSVEREAGREVASLRKEVTIRAKAL